MADTQDRTARDLKTRTQNTRAVYVPPTNLPDPTPEPGWVYRWIATHVMGEAQHNNVSKKMREGWEPVKSEDHPELRLMGNNSGNVEIGGLMLCKMAKEQADARDDYYNKQAQNQMESVDNHYLRNNDPRMPLFAERKSTTTRGNFGSGTK